MTLEQARRVSDLIKTLDDAKEWGDSFREKSEKGRNFILFEEQVCALNIDGNGERGGWEGPIRVPREIAAEMMGWLEDRVRSELHTLGVTIEPVEFGNSANFSGNSQS